MGTAQSHLDPRHVGIYQKLLAIQNSHTRLQMIDTLMGDPSIVQSAKQAGIYGQILQYAAAIRHNSTPPKLPGEGQSQPQTNQGHAQRGILPAPVIQTRLPQTQGTNQTQLVQQGGLRNQDPFQQVGKAKRSEKALSFFTACLKVLNIQEEVALTEDMLKTAYKKSAIRAHPDKPGGSKEAFDAVTRAYAYLLDILKLIKGRQTSGEAGGAAVPGLERVREQRQEATTEWQMPAEPVKLNPNNLDLNKFNQMFEQTRIPDPDEDGYGDWLKGADSGNGKIKHAKKFSESFNREVFNRMFEDEAKTSRETAIQSWQQPQELTLAVGMGVELGRDRPSDYTAAPNSKQQFTDLRAAYTSENTVSNQIQGVRVDNRDFNSYKAQRERAPDAYNQSELAQLQAYEAQKKAQEDARRVRAAQEQLTAQDYFSRMKQLVITQK
jgi:curved DNA-binding protein CbpA